MKTLSPAKLKACTNCAGLIAIQQDICKHPVLKTIVCKPCYYSYTKVYDLTKYRKGTDLDGQENYCRWCLDGGELILCGDESCRNGFCAACIKRNFGEAVSESIINSEDWYCFICDYTQLDHLRAAADECIPNEISRHKEQPEAIVVDSPPSAREESAEMSTRKPSQPETVPEPEHSEEPHDVSNGHSPALSINNNSPSPAPAEDPIVEPAEKSAQQNPAKETSSHESPNEKSPTEAIIVDNVPEEANQAPSEEQSQLNQPKDLLVEPTRVRNEKLPEQRVTADKTADQEQVEKSQVEETSAQVAPAKSQVEKLLEKSPTKVISNSSEKLSTQLVKSSKKKFDFKIFSSTTLLGRPTEVTYDKNPPKLNKDATKQSEPPRPTKNDKAPQPKVTEQSHAKLVEPPQTKTPESSSAKSADPMRTKLVDSAHLKPVDPEASTVEISKEVTNSVSLEEELYVSDDSSDESAFVDARSHAEPEPQPLRWALKDAPLLKRRVRLLLDTLEDAYTSFDIKRFEANPNEYLSFIDNLGTFLKGASSVANRCQDICNSAAYLRD